MDRSQCEFDVIMSIASSWLIYLPGPSSQFISIALMPAFLPRKTPYCH